MAVRVKKSNLQLDKYKYTWSRDKGDGEYYTTPICQDNNL